MLFLTSCRNLWLCNVLGKDDIERSWNNLLQICLPYYLEDDNKYLFQICQPLGTAVQTHLVWQAVRFSLLDEYFNWIKTKQTIGLIFLSWRRLSKDLSFDCPWPWITHEMVHSLSRTCQFNHPSSNIRVTWCRDRLATHPRKGLTICGSVCRETVHKLGPFLQTQLDWSTL